jgi:hypothetical protein
LQAISDKRPSFQSDKGGFVTLTDRKQRRDTSVQIIGRHFYQIREVL